VTTTDIQRRRTGGQLSTLPIEVEQHHVRAARKPWVAMSLLVLAASAERIAVHATGEEQILLYGAATLYFVAAVVVGSRSRHRLMGKHLRRRFIAAVWGAASWLSYVAAVGLTWGSIATLVTVGSMLSLLFWREHRVYGRGPAPVMLPVGEDNMFVDRWNKNLGGKGKKLAGTKLTEMEIIRSGYRFTLELVPGTQTVSQVQGMIASLRGGLRLLPGQDLIVEAHPEEPEPTALLTIITKSTVKADQIWPGPELSFDAERGSALMGPYIDGEGIARWSTYRKDGMFGGFIQGGIGSGKSRLIENIATALASSKTHPTTIWFACGQGGASSPYLMKKATATATTGEQVYQMLLAAVAVMDVNGLENQANNATGFFPTVERPGLLIIIDEFHNFLDEAILGDLAIKIQGLMVKLAREARKAGVALLLATQEPLLAAFGHPRHADNLRARLLEGNGVMMRSETNNAKQVFKVDVNAREFPEMPGYGFLARPAPGDRQAPFRGYYVDEAAQERWSHTFDWRVLSRLQESAVAEDAGRWYADRNKLAQSRQADITARLERLRSGMAVPREDRVAEQVAEDTGVRVTRGASFGDGMPGVDDVTKFWAAGPAPMHEPSARERSLTEPQRRVATAIRDGAVTPTAIQAATGLAKTRVHELLKELTAMEVIEKPTGYGSYAVVG
jgi:hypothetical protein